MVEKAELIWEKKCKKNNKNSLDFLNIDDLNNLIFINKNFFKKVFIYNKLLFSNINNKEIIQVKNDFNFSQNFAYLMFAENDKQGYIPSKSVVDALDKLFILHADHEQNASTSAVKIFINLSLEFSLILTELTIFFAFFAYRNVSKLSS